MKFLVTGGAGFIGSNLANALADTNESSENYGADDDIRQLNNTLASQAADTLNYSKDKTDVHIVIVLDDLFLGSPSNLSKKVRFVNGSVMNYDLVLELSKGCDYIFHHAALSSSPMFIDDPRRGMDVNIIGFMNVMESAKRNKVKRVIYASSSSLYNGLPTPWKESVDLTPKTFYESSFYCREMELILLVLDILVYMDQMKNTKADLRITYPSLFGIWQKRKRVPSFMETEARLEILHS